MRSGCTACLFCVMMAEQAKAGTRRCVRVRGETGRSVGELYGDHGPDAVRLAFLLTGSSVAAEDLVHDAFVRLLTRLPVIRRPEGRRAYLMKTVVHLAKNDRRRLRVEKSYRNAHPSDSTGATVHLPDFESRDELWRALQQLPHRQRAAVVLRYCEDLSEEQTADLLSTSSKAVRSLVSKGMATLRARTGRE